jgi:hypothetical protein
MSLILGPTTDLLRVTTGQASTIDVHASWLDNAAGSITPSRTNTATISAATTTTVVGSPAASTQRNVKGLTIRNRDAAVACDITVVHTDGTNALELIKCTLAAGESLHYFEGIGFSAYASNGAVKQGFDPNNVAFTGGVMTGVDITAKAGVAGGAGLTMPAGTLATSPASGDFESDGVVGYYTPVAAERGVILGQSFISIQGGTYTLASQTAAQKLFNSPTNGQLTVGGNRTYMFECFFDLSSLSASAGAFGFALGGTATFTYSKWTSDGNKNTLATAAASQNTVNVNSLANTTIVTSTTGPTVGWAFIVGILRVNAGGTIIPQVSLGVAAAAVVGRDSYFRIWPIGAGNITSVGNWS